MAWLHAAGKRYPGLDFQKHVDKKQLVKVTAIKRAAQRGEAEEAEKAGAAAGEPADAGEDALCLGLSLAGRHAGRGCGGFDLGPQPLTSNDGNSITAQLTAAQVHHMAELCHLF